MKPLLFICLLLSVENLLSQDIFQNLRIDDRNRSMIIHLPENYEQGKEYPMIINLHAFLSNAAQQRNYTRFNKLADQENIVVVYPQGVNKRWNAGEFFGVKGRVDDVAFMGSIIDFMALKYKIDTRRVYATGYSSGGFMCYRLACELPERIAAIAPVASSMTTEVFTTCDPQFNIPILAMNGTADPVTIYNGFVSVTSIPKVMKFLGDEFNCMENPVSTLLPNVNTQDRSSIEKIAFQDCDDETELLFYKIKQGGHTWPGANPFALIGNTNQDIDANEEIWGFFKDKSIKEDAICSELNNLSVSLVSNQAYSFSWDDEQLENKYDLILFNDENIQFVENVSGGNLNLNVSLEDSFKWVLRTTCVSGYVSYNFGEEMMIQENKEDAGEKLSVFPNPSNGNLTLNTINIKPASWELSISDVYGVVKARALINNVNDQLVSLNVEHLNKGRYILSLLGNGEVYTTSFYKE